MNMNAIYYKLFPALAVAAGFCSGCVTEQKLDGTGILENYVNQYIWPAESLHVTDYSMSDDYLRINIEGEEVFTSSPKFDEFAGQYGDTSYNRRGVPGQYPVVYGAVTSIDVVCEDDFCGYPAGSSLNEIAVLETSSPYWFIQSGYDRDKYDSRPKDEELRDGYYGYYHTRTICSELVPGELFMVDPECWLNFLKTPEDGGGYRFTVTLGIEGKEVTGSSYLYFIKNRQ